MKDITNALEEKDREGVHKTKSNQTEYHEMTKTAKTITYAAGIFTAFWLIIAFLITSVEAVAYWTPGYYEKEYTKYQVLNDLP